MIMPQNNKHTFHHPSLFPDYLDKKVSEKQNHSGILCVKRWWGFGMAVASSGPHANDLHLDPDG